MILSTLYIGYRIISLHNKPAVYTLAVKLCLGNGSHMTFNFAFHCLSPEWMLKETWSAFANILSISVGGRTHARKY